MMVALAFSHFAPCFLSRSARMLAAVLPRIASPLHAASYSYCFYYYYKVFFCIMQRNVTTKIVLLTDF